MLHLGVDDSKRGRKRRVGRREEGRVGGREEGRKGEERREGKGEERREGWREERREGWGGTAAHMDVSLGVIQQSKVLEHGSRPDNKQNMS